MYYDSDISKQMHLKIIVLRLLDGKSRSGYDLMKAIAAASGWKPSPGSMYPVPELLEKERLVKVQHLGKKKLYRLSPAGEKLVRGFSQQTGKIVEIAAAIAGFSLLKVPVNFWIIAFGLGFAFLVGVVSETLPAVRASKLNPVEALRYE